MTPIRGRIIAKRDEATYKIGNIVHLPRKGQHKAKEGSRMGTVLAVNDESPVKVGDRILFTEYAGNTVEIYGPEVYIVAERLILATLED